MQVMKRWGELGLLARWRLWHANDRSLARAAQLHNARVARWAAPFCAALAWLAFAAAALDGLNSERHQGPVPPQPLILIVHAVAGLTLTTLAINARPRHARPMSPWRDGPHVLLAAAVLVWTALAGGLDRTGQGHASAFLLGALGSVIGLRLPPRRWAVLLAAGATTGILALLQTASAGPLAQDGTVLVLGAALCWVAAVVLWDAFLRLNQQQAALDQAQQSLASQQRELLRLTRLDGLTQLYNRRTFVELAEQELARARRQRLHTSIVLLDVDWFKRINDTWGHPAGDAVLKHLAAVASASVRSTDLIGRLGGEEFIVLLPATPPVSARILAEKLRVAVAERPLHWQNQRIECSISLGVAGTHPQHACDFDTLYSQADAALYQAKAQGRNRVVLASPGGLKPGCGRGG
ncbi:MAG: hypothetical protein OHK0048_10780 [Rhodoferax sp.]